MANPLIGAYQRTTSKKPPNSTPIPPNAETVVGTVFPYRGMENHGVSVNHDRIMPFTAWDDADDGADVPYELPNEPDPVPVRVVSKATREIIKFRTNYFDVTNAVDPIQILGQDDARISVTIRAHSVEQCLISNEPYPSEQNSFRFDNAAPIVLKTTDAIYVRNPFPGDLVSLSVLVEYVLEVER